MLEGLALPVTCVVLFLQKILVIPFGSYRNFSKGIILPNYKARKIWLFDLSVNPIITYILYLIFLHRTYHLHS